ncbi:hypothetical protein [Alienimonas californiensis]|uniref:WD40-like Beta Propeller Repeat protein n=1 Tax=Alienimonas californiensis TaxID=2527989 RepID=A0A517P9D5_9PLAN|nr:hypothetical protein [Alienimonas californiensis]QDT15989.1 hypothetical protein CA12_20870 [Alienimonas californiensis]
MPSLFVLTAADADRAVILRRGPTKWFHVIGWDTRRDVFEHGAWIRGRIYEPACDLSPDGRLLIAFISKHSAYQFKSSYTHAWTSISRAPWLQALALWPQGTTYYGGGRWDGPRSLVARFNPEDVHPQHPANGLTVRSSRSVEGSSVPIHTAGDLVPDADWSGRDQRGEVIFTRAGRLFRIENGEKRQIADFTDLTPDPQPAPEWAGRPLS